MCISQEIIIPQTGPKKDTCDKDGFIKVERRKKRPPCRNQCGTAQTGPNILLRPAVPTTQLYVSRLHHTTTVEQIVEYVRSKTNWTLRVAKLESRHNTNFNSFMQPLNFDWWEIDIMFKVTGRGRIGADGLAFWYTTQRGDYTGEVFGSSDRWNGLAVIFDSFDNDNKHNNPYIMAVLNDGTKVFDHKSDGSQQLLSGCLRDFRNKPFPTRARIEYYLNTLTVYFHNGMTNNEADYELCGQQMSSDEQQKLSQEYQEYQKKLEQQKEDYRKEHPDEVRDKDGEFEDWFESDAQRELRQIFQGQGQIHDILRDLNKKVDEVIGKQMNSLSMLTAVYGHTQGQPIQPGAAPPQQMPTLPIGRHDWDALVANNQIMINTIAELKGFIIDVSRKSDSLAAATGAGAAGAGASPQLLNELRDSMQQVKATVTGVAQRLATQQPQVAGMSACPDVSCVSFTGLLVVVAAQLALMLIYAMYKERKEAQAKKFF
ncbi:hypothetical protein B5X24_HaOG209011 [Helicoverpa armigera]|uniref:L-type lectin-like domain-containing protein n=1 Tax=Helicoverpa armigera TaxID=29058 RepID=A0A2W1BK40_HELAM|nr:hypothetical protein B5X24_HaOG209011 [Helicoverpa armigera]